jgi:hypothetical protein
VSNPLAIAATTSALGQFLTKVSDGLILPGTGVTTAALDAARSGSDKGRQLNLFLYRVSSNGTLQNRDLPYRNGAGELITQPVLALDLHYLLTAYGNNDDELDAQHLLAQAMSVVHEQGIMTRDWIRAAVAADPNVAASDLADQVELIKIAPEPMNLEELSKLWAMFPSTNYRLSTAYQVTVNLISRPHAPRSALPVRAANVTVATFRQPVIDGIAPSVATPGGSLQLQGRNLSADGVTVQVGSVEVVPDKVADRVITVTLPGSLPAGVTSVRVIQRVRLGTPPTPHHGFDSNVAAFVLAPVITTAPPITVARGNSLTLAFTPPVSRAQQVALLLNDRAIAIAARKAGTAPVSSLAFPIPTDLSPGSYLVRLRIDGAESALVVETNQAKGTFNQYVAPVVTVT